MISEELKDRILQKVKIEDVVGEFVELKRKGARYVGLCPFHDDRHVGNFSVYPAKNCYKCFSCEAKGGPVEFLMQHRGMSYPDAIRYLGHMVDIDVDGYRPDPTEKTYTPPPPLPTLYLPTRLVQQRENYTSTLHHWLRSLPWDNAQAARVEEVFRMYHVGTSAQGHTIFWQIDESDTAHTGKMMKYRPDGHRDREAPYNFDWVHAALARGRPVRNDHGSEIFDDDGRPVFEYPWRNIYDPETTEMRQCLFGLHLLKRYPAAEVHIVESEKTAVFCSIFFGDYDRDIWLASGGLTNLTNEKLGPLIRQRRVIALHPDVDGVEKWEKQRKTIDYDRIYINNTVMTFHWKEADGPKADIADVLCRELIEGSRSHKTMKLSELIPRIYPATRLKINDNG